VRLFDLIWRNVKQRGLSSTLTSLSVALGVMLVTGILLLQNEMEQHFRKPGEGYSIVVGAPGSALQLTLNAIYHLDKSPGLMPMRLWPELEANESVALAVPYAVGDSFRGHRVVATTDALFDERFPHPDGAGEAKLAEGRPFRFDREALFAQLESLGALGLDEDVGADDGPEHADEDHEDGGEHAEQEEGDHAGEDHGDHPDEGHEDEGEHADEDEGEHADEDHEHADEDHDEHDEDHDEHGEDHDDGEEHGEDHDEHDEHGDGEDQDDGEDHDEHDDGEHTDDAHGDGEHADHDDDGEHHEDHDDDEHDEHDDDEHDDGEHDDGEDHEEHDDEHEDHGDHDHGHEGVYEAVLGAEVADRLGIQVGDRIEPTHGIEEDGAHAHEHEHLWEVVGIFERTRTPVDDVVFINLDSFFAIEEHMEGALIPGTTEAGLSSILLFPRPGVHKAVLLSSLNRRPDVAVADVSEQIRNLFQIVGSVDSIFLLVAILVVVIGVLSILVAIYNTMNERRREVAILRAIGASRRTVFSAIVGEAVLLTAIGGVAGILLGHLLVAINQARVEEVAGFRPDATTFLPIELVVLGVVLVGGALAGMLPAWKAYRTDVAKNLRPLS